MRKFLTKIYKNPHFGFVVVILIMGVLASRTLLFQKGYFNMHDDLQMMRQLEMEKCFVDGQIPCRWVPDMGYGYGFPLFNFYPPLPYLVGEIFRVLGFSFVEVAKLTFALGIVASATAMYIFANELFLNLLRDKEKSKYAAVISSAFYVWAPYHSVDVYVRGAMNESWAFIWFPLILLAAYKIIHLGGVHANTSEVLRSRTKRLLGWWIVVLALSWFGLLTSHNLMVMIFTPVFAVWCLIWILKSKNFKSNILHLASSGLLAFGLAAFFTLPALLEQKYVQVNTLVVGYYEYIAHFATIRQLLFSRFWGYGPSVWGVGDGMSFQIGYGHWILSIIVMTIWLYGRFVKKKYQKFDYWLLIIGYFFAVGWFAAFMAHNRSTFIWQYIPFLKFVQFPWRFLTLVVLSFSIIAGSIVFLLPKKFKYRKFIYLLVFLVVIILNWKFFLPEHGRMGPLTDEQKFSSAAWDLQRTAGIFDYLPTTARENPKAPPSVLAEVVDGKTSITDMQQGTNWARFKVNGGSSLVRINIFKFPNWKTYIDGVEVNNFVPKDETWGRMYINVPKGKHEVYAKLHNTPVRKVANTISLFTWLGLITFPFWRLKMLKSKVWKRIF